MSEWKTVRLRDVASIRRGLAPKYVEDDGIVVINQRCIRDGGIIDLSACKFTSKSQSINADKFIYPFDILVNSTGEGTLGRSVQILSVEQPMTVDSHVTIVRSKENFIDARFLGFIIRSNYQRITLMARGSTGQTDLPKDTFLSLPIPLPPLPEQRAIAEILGSLDDQIENLRRMNATLEETARALFKEWFVDFRYPGHEDVPLVDSELGLIPSGWRVGNLSDLCRISRGASPRPINDYMNGTVPWIKIADATAANGPFIFETKEKVKQEGVSKSVFLTKGTLILSNSATTGIPVFLEVDGCIHDGWLYFSELHTISQNHLYFVLLNISSHLTSIADGTVQKNLNTALVGSQRILIPNAGLLEQFDSVTLPFFQQIKSNSYQSRTLAETRDALLPKLMSGEIRVPHP